MQKRRPKLHHNSVLNNHQIQRKWLEQSLAMMDNTILTIRGNTIWCISRQQIHKVWQWGQVTKKCLKVSWLMLDLNLQLNRSVCLFQILESNFRIPYSTPINIDHLRLDKWKSESHETRFKVQIAGIGNLAWTLNKITELEEVRGLTGLLSNKGITVPHKIITHSKNQCQEYSKSKANNS